MPAKLAAPRAFDEMEFMAPGGRDQNMSERFDPVGSEYPKS